MTADKIIIELKKHARRKNREGMARFGISGKNILGVPIPVLRKKAKEIKKEKIDNHRLADELWQSEIHEARILASMIDEPEKVTSKQMDAWIKCFDSWDLCDQVCMNLFDKTKFAYVKVEEWTKKKSEFEKRAGFALMAVLAWHKKNEDRDAQLKAYLPMIYREATDERNYVRKAVNWALREIGKRNDTLKKEAIRTAEKILKIDNKAAQWIAKDALRELALK